MFDAEVIGSTQCSRKESENRNAGHTIYYHDTITEKIKLFNQDYQPKALGNGFGYSIPLFYPVRHTNTISYISGKQQSRIILLNCIDLPVSFL